MVIRGYQTCMRAASVVAPLAIWEAGSALVSPLNIVSLLRSLGRMPGAPTNHQIPNQVATYGRQTQWSWCEGKG